MGEPKRGGRQMGILDSERQDTKIEVVSKYDWTGVDLHSLHVSIRSGEEYTVFEPLPGYGLMFTPSQLLIMMKFAFGAGRRGDSLTLIDQTVTLSYEKEPKRTSEA